MTSSVSPEQACVQWRNMIDLFESAVQCTTFDAGRLGSFSHKKLLAVYHYEKAHGGLSAAAARANVPPDILQALVQSLRSVLDGFIEPESDRLGYGLVNLMGGLPQPKVTDFARILVRAAATLGAHRVVQLLFEWANGGRLRYRTRALLAGVSVGNRIALEDGLEITRLPTSGNKLPRTGAGFQHADARLREFLGWRSDVCRLRSRASPLFAAKVRVATVQCRTHMGAGATPKPLVRYILRRAVAGLKSMHSM